MNNIIQFSKRENEIIGRLLQGKSNKQIALSLGISVNTVEYHLKNIYKKLQVSSRTEAVLRLGESVGNNNENKLGKSVVEISDKTVENDRILISTKGTPVNRKFMMISGLLTIVLVVMIVFAFPHTQDTNATPTNALSIPDLTITSAYVSMVDGNGRCLPYYGLVVNVVNQGSVTAPDVFLAETNTGEQVGIGTINPQQSITMPFVAKAANGVYNVVVDPQNAIVESNEDNNSATFSGATATPPASCLETSWGVSTPTPLLSQLENTSLAPSTSPLPPTPFPTPTLPASLTPLVFTDPFVPMSARIVYYYFVTPTENPLPEGSVVISPEAYILAPTRSNTKYSPDTVANLRTALDDVLKDDRNGWLSSNVKIVDVTFGGGHADIVLQGEYFGVGDTTLIAARMQILMTVFANASVATATVTLNGDTIGNLGISHSINTKPANYVFTRTEIETFMDENAYVSP